jgi:predicted restriction endonuclease
VAGKIGRSPSAFGMKMCNFARFDPILQKRNIKGLEHGGKRDEEVWGEFHNDWEALAFESQRALERLIGAQDGKRGVEPGQLVGDGPTEVERTTRVRLVQRFFRESVLAGYRFTCAICLLNLESMLNASHIVPWSVDKSRRADPSNGLALCVFHDRAFDRGLITLDEHFRVLVSRTVRAPCPPKLHRVGLLDIEGQGIMMPDKFMPDQRALAYHREQIFAK